MARTYAAEGLGAHGLLPGALKRREHGKNVGGS